MEFDTITTAVAFAAVVLLGTGGMVVAPFMRASTVVTMVLPSMVVFGLICLAIGLKHGEYRAGHSMQ
jgi:hypothetical protein